MTSMDLIESYLTHLRKETRTPNTIKAYRRTLTVLDRELPCGLDVATGEELESWLWRDGTHPRETYYSELASFYRWAYDTELIDYDPSAVITRPKGPSRRLPKPASDAQVGDVLARAAEPYRLWVVLAVYAGLRCIEVSRLLREDITERTITVRQGKGDKPRVVGTHPVVWDAVRDLPPGPITDRTAQQISIGVFTHMRRLGHPLSMHRFRHWFGTSIQRLYKDLRVTQEAMGHADPRTTAGYALVAAER
jgi:integrase/recombinase XerC